MIKTMTLAFRREGMPVEEFQAYWREEHAPLALKVPGLRRYIQCHTLPETYEAEQPPSCDGVAQLYFDDLEGLDAARRSPEFQALVEDAPHFLAPQRVGLIARERAIIDELPDPLQREGMIKRMGFLVRREGMSPEEFQRYWHDVHAPMVVKGLTMMRRYVQAHPLPELYGTDREPSAADGVAESWWSDSETDQLGSAPASDAHPAAVADLANFAGRSRFLPIATQEVVILA